MFNSFSVLYSLLMQYRKDVCMSKRNVKNEHDQGAKIVFENPEMCVQFLDGYIPIDCLKGLKAEQIEDMSQRFVTMWDNERDSDVVKKIHLNPDMELFLIAIIEHQSDVDFTMVMKLLRYMIMIWTDYEKEMEEKQPGITKMKEFKYPPILPIVYFEGTGAWTAAKRFSERIALSDVFEEYIPDFHYKVVRIHDYTDDEIIEKGNELSLIMLVNKLKKSEDIIKLKELPKNYLENLQEHSTKQLLELIATVVSVFMRRMNVPKEEIADFTDQILERRIPMLFDSFEAYDVQETRRVSEIRGKDKHLISQIQKKVQREKSLKQIAEELEETIENVRDLYEVVLSNKDKSAEEICEVWTGNNSEDQDI